MKNFNKKKCVELLTILVNFLETLIAHYIYINIPQRFQFSLDAPPSKRCLQLWYLYIQWGRATWIHTRVNNWLSWNRRSLSVFPLLLSRTPVSLDIDVFGSTQCHFATLFCFVLDFSTTYLFSRFWHSTSRPWPLFRISAACVVYFCSGFQHPVRLPLLWITPTSTAYICSGLHQYTSCVFVETKE